MTTVDQLADIAVQLAVRIRDDDPQANGRWLAAMLPDPADWFRLAFVLAAAVPDDRPWQALTAWTLMTHPSDDHPDVPGTAAAAAWHRSRREQLCEGCRTALRDERYPERSAA